MSATVTPPKGRPRSRILQKSAYTLEDLEQVKVLADPLRIRILEAFCEERTTKQVADLLGEKPTKLYHHVDALQRVGLITLARTRQNRGTVEKYYLAVARTFVADSRVFQPAQKGKNRKAAGLGPVMANIFETTSAELAALIARGDQGTKGIEEAGMVTFLEIRGSKARLREIRGKLQAVVAEATGKGDDRSDQGRYRLTLAYYPLEGA